PGEDLPPYAEVRLPPGHRLRGVGERQAQATDLRKLASSHVFSSDGRDSHALRGTAGVPHLVDPPPPAALVAHPAGGLQHSKMAVSASAAGGKARATVRCAARKRASGLAAPADSVPPSAASRLRGGGWCACGREAPGRVLTSLAECVTQSA